LQIEIQKNIIIFFSYTTWTTIGLAFLLYIPIYTIVKNCFFIFLVFSMNLVVIGAALAIILATLGVTIGQGWITKTSMKNLGVNPELSGTLTMMTILGVALVESCAIYGLIVAFQILEHSNLSRMTSLTAGLTVGIPAMIVGLIEGGIARNAMDAVLRNPEAKGKIMISMIIFIALIESCAIYGLIIAFRMLGS
jgi:F-type H+-transporting ATPase subunit c